MSLKDDIKLAKTSSIRLEYDQKRNKVFLIPSSTIYCLQGVVKNKVASGTKLLMQNKDVLEVGNASLHIGIDYGKGNILAKNPKAKAHLEKKYGKLWLIGYGGIASVYVVGDGRLALKVLAKGYGDPKIIQRFVGAAEKIKELDHLGLLRVGETFQHPEMPLYYTEMEFCQGVTLAEVIERRGTFADIQYSFSIIKQLANVVNYLSSQNIVHRDINPKNILIDKKMGLKLLGITLVKSIDSQLTQKGTKMFTPNFTAPEQIVDPSQVGSKADVFSLGAVAYYLLAGVPPFGARNHSAYIKMLQKKEVPVALDTLKADIPTYFCNLIARTLSFQHAQRPTVNEFIIQYRKVITFPTRRIRKYTEKDLKNPNEMRWDQIVDLNEIRQLGRFKILQEVGQGGLGRVYEAWDEKMGRKVALKLLRRGMFANDEDLRRFQEEARVVSRLKHTGIGRVYEIGEQKGYPYIVMEFIEGVSLLEWASQSTPREIAEKIKEIADILEYAHSQNIIHRDIKPSNILVTRSNHAFLLDFGMARDQKRTAHMTKTGKFMGTPAYASPEQFRGEPPHPQMDVYSLGIVFYELLTKKLPYEGESLSLMSNIAKGNLTPTPPRAINSQIAGDLETICLCAMSPDKSERYLSPQALADDIDRFLNGEMIKARPMSSVKNSWFKIKRNWYYVVPTILASFFLLVLLFYIPEIRRYRESLAISFNLDRGRELLNKFPGKKPRQVFREARYHLESARRFAQKNEDVRKVLAALHKKYGIWALKKGQLELVKDCVSNLEILGEKRIVRDLNSRLNSEMIANKNRKILLDWEQSPEIRIKAARALANDYSERTQKVLQNACEDPDEKIAEIVKEIYKQRYQKGSKYQAENKKNGETKTTEKKFFQPAKKVNFLQNVFPVDSRSNFPCIIFVLAMINEVNSSKDIEKIAMEYFYWISKYRFGIYRSSIQSLSKLIEHPEIRVQAAAISLSSFYGKKGQVFIPVLIRKLAHQDKKIAEKSYEALVKLGVYDQQTLLQSLRDKKKIIRQEIERIIVQIGDPFLPELFEMMKERQHPLRKRALGMIERMKRKAVPFLIRKLNLPSSGLRFRIIALIEKVGIDALPELIHALKNSKTLIVTEKVIDIIGRLGPKAEEAIPELIKKLDVNSMNTRYKALKALLSINPKAERILPTLLGQLATDDRAIRQLILKGLKRIGKKGVEAGPQLLRMLKQKSNRDMQMQIVEALIAIKYSDSKSRSILEKVFQQAKGKLAYSLSYLLLKLDGFPSPRIKKYADILRLSEKAKKRRKIIRRLKTRQKQSYYLLMAGLKDLDPSVKVATIQVLEKQKNISEKLLFEISKLLSSEYSKVRVQCIRTLGHFGKKSFFAVDKIIKNFQDDISDVRYAAVSNIFKISPPSISVIVNLLKSLPTSNEEVVQKALSELEKRKNYNYSKDMVVALLPLLDDDTRSTRKYVIIFLGYMKKKATSSIPTLLKLYRNSLYDLNPLLKKTLYQIGFPSSSMKAEMQECIYHSSRKVQEETLRFLQKMGSRASYLWFSVLYMYKRAPDPKFAKLIDKTLKEIGKPGEEELPQLMKEIKNRRHWQIRYHSLDAVSRFGAKAVAAIPNLIKILVHDHRSSVREKAKFALVQMGVKAIPALMDILKKEKVDRSVVRSRVASILGEMGNQALPKLLSALKTTKDVHLKTGVSMALGQMGNLSLASLLKMLKKGNDKEKANAAWALFYVGPNAAPYLLPNLREKDSEIRRHSVWILGLIGKNSRNVIPELKQLIHDPNFEVRWELTLAFRKLALASRDPHQAVNALVELIQAETELMKKTKNKQVRKKALQALYKICKKRNIRNPQVIDLLRTYHRWP